MIAVAAGGVLWLAPDRYLPWDTADFPAVDTTALSPQQARIVGLLETEHGRQRPGTFFSEGVEEPWCADFVSWIMREAGQPLSNPNSGHWRIPGVYTLREYYESQSRFEQVGAGYRPTVGDVVLYDNSSWVGQHTNIVVAVDGDTATTVGGNEFGRIRVHTVDWSTDSAVVGFGRLG
ncbi:CHAP domain-containing protein [Rhodococcus jostii]|uniref:CHAP domain-containing protein n=2 Tax=Rhodococcus jostii TaxID=132919 RepID=A0A1H5IY52_RHOJO|nr:CHAP domain-containing protein [Rhodococcus jostii]